MASVGVYLSLGESEQFLVTKENNEAVYKALAASKEK